MIEEVLDSLIDDQKDLTEEEASACMDDMILGNCNDNIIAAFLIALRIKGETIPEITGFAKTMASHGLHVDYIPKGYMLDVCGTGGDVFKTFNVSTAASIIASSGGAEISKHGNRSVSSKFGGADVLEAMGVNIMPDPEVNSYSLDHCNYGFLFAPKYHPATKNVMGIRKSLGTHTVFNLLGPLTCPSNLNAQFTGIYDPDLIEDIAEVLVNLGRERAMVFHGFDNEGNPAMDEISIIGKTKVAFIDHGNIDVRYISPETFGCDYVNPDYIRAPNTENEHVQIIYSILNNKQDTPKDKARLELACINSAGMLYVADKVKSLEDGFDYSKELLADGSAKEELKKIRYYSNLTIDDLN
jgi:anthranilate phosphoribosyltransferase